MVKRLQTLEEYKALKTKDNGWFGAFLTHEQIKSAKQNSSFHNLKLVIRDLEATNRTVYYLCTEKDGGKWLLFVYTTKSDTHISTRIINLFDKIQNNQKVTETKLSSCKESKNTYGGYPEGTPSACPLF